MSAPETIMGTHAEEGRFLSLQRMGITVIAGPQKGEERTLDGDTFRIGKSNENHLALNDDTVSRFHCEIYRDKRGFLLRDLGSTNGTMLDNAEIKEAYVKPGSLIQIGNVTLKVRPFAERLELLPSEKSSFGEVVGSSAAMRQIFGLLERLGPTDATVLIGGETGTGKDVLARSIHQLSPRKARPFMVVDCGAIVASLIEAELFGHERGSFTGATGTRQGAFELANGGTLFLDEIGELPLDLQPKLLRAIESRAFRRVGGSKEIKVDIRIIAASKRNLKADVERGKFREDLYFRLAVVPVTLPPLRERREDIPLLAERLITQIAQGDDAKLVPMKLGRAALDALRAHDWPGNIRELRNVLERAAYLARAAGDTEVRMLGLPGVDRRAPGALSVPGPGGETTVFSFDDSRSYRDTRAQWESAFEVAYVSWLLAKHGGNISGAARAADMDRKYLYKLVKKHGLHPDQEAEVDDDKDPSGS